MSFNISEISKTEKNAIFNIAKDEVQNSYSEIVKLFQKDADLKGFRKGKVPFKVVESIYADQIIEELKSRLINNNLRRLAVEEKINVVKTSNLECKDINKDSNFEFSFNFEFIPEIKLVPYKTMEVEKEVYSVKQKDIDTAIKNLLTNFASNEEVTKRKKAKKKDILSINFSGEVDGESIKDLSRDNAIIELGNDSLIPEIESHIEGMTIGEEKVFDVRYPKDFPIADAADKNVTSKVFLNKIYKKVIPKLNEEFFKKIGIESKEKLEERVSQDLDKSHEDKSEASLRKNIGDKLIKENDFEFPVSFLTDEEQRLSNEYLRRMNEQGIKITEIEQKTKDVISESALRNVKLALIFAEIAKLEQISVSEEELEEVLLSIANSQKTSVSKVKKYYKDNNLMDDVRVKLTDEKVIRFLISDAKINEVESKA
ncbi:trigger factor [bacterium]|jgi:trigger factor|nr:trigger factor [bacterium]MBT3850556.1 trigger factor [bacterium]MBT4434753.1 trigger factor [bacterium]MDG2445575.1 trigger factor [Thermodesulfobacteriota bacterium]|tara:strand:+ start:59 stop:1342 length:1284 start_codon:yes stop_codon:yes gene_type:complete